MHQTPLGNGNNPFQVYRVAIALQDSAVASVAKRYVLYSILMLALQGTPAWCGGAKPDQTPDQGTRSARPSPNRPDSARPRVASPPASPPEAKHPRTPDPRPAPRPSSMPSVRYDPGHKEHAHRRNRPSVYIVPVYAYPPYPVEMTEEDAMSVAESQTGGQAVSARRIDLNGATGGYEVIVQMPGKEKGWRVVIDIDTRRVKDTYPIPNPVEVVDAPRPREEPPVVDEPAPAPKEPQRVENSQPRAPVSNKRLYRWRNSKDVICITDYPPPKGFQEIKG